MNRYFISTLLATALLSAGCMSDSPVKLDHKQAQNQNIMVGKVSQHGADISVAMDFGKHFSTQATADGIAPARLSDISHLKLYLTTSETDPLDVTALKFGSAVLGFDSSNTVFTFSNVPPGGPYFIAVELFSSVNGNSSDNLIEPIAYGGTTGTRGITVSSAPVASVTVNSDNKVSHNNNLTVTPLLKAGIGASVDATVTPSDGSATNGSITVN